MTSLLKRLKIPSMARTLTFLLVIFLLIFPSSLLAWQGKVVGISDGDTILVLRDYKEIKIRLWGIDCPERRQDFGNRAKGKTSEPSFGKAVEIDEIDKDRYGRIVAVVILPGGQVLNEELIKTGMAWVFKKYCNSPDVCSKWQVLELAAKSQKIGLWSMPKPIPPWEFRRH